MHEARLCLSLLQIAEEALARGGGERIVALDVEVGVLSGVAAEALDAAFPVCAEGTSAQGAALRLRAVPGRELLLCALEVE